MSLKIRRALYQKLTGTQAVSSKLATPTSVFHEEAPEGAAYPFVIIAQQAKSRTRAFAKATAFETEVWLVKAVDRNTTSDAVDQISEAAESVLANGTLTVTGGTVDDIYPTANVEYIEQEGDQSWRHAGVLYRIVSPK